MKVALFTDSWIKVSCNLLDCYSKGGHGVPFHGVWAPVTRGVFEASSKTVQTPAEIIVSGVT